MGWLNALFLKTLNMAVAASWLIAALLLLRPVLKRIAPKWLVCALWALVAIRLVFPASLLHSDLSAYRLAGDAVQESGQVTYFKGASDTDYSVASYTPATLLPGGEALLADDAPPLANDAPSAPAATVPLSSARDYHHGILSALWAFGVLVMLTMALVSYARVTDNVSVSAPLEKTVYLCDDISSPFILGVLRPRIYLTSGMGETARACVLRHERAHLRRGDHIWKPLGYLLLAVYWYDPLAWVAYLCFCRDMELACDERVIRTMAAEERADYTQALLDCACGRCWVTACPLAFGEVGVKTRVKSVLHYKKPAFWGILAAIVVCAAVAVCFLTDPKAVNEPDAFLKELAKTVRQTDTATLTWREGDIEVSDDTVPGSLVARLLTTGGWTYQADSDSGETAGEEPALCLQLNRDTALQFYSASPAQSVRIQTGDTLRWYSMGDMTCAEVLTALGPDRAFQGEAAQTACFFGHYEQDGSTANGSESIQWLVLAQEDDRLLLVSRYALDFQSYMPLYETAAQSAAWQNSSLRSWLNTTFINAAFTTEEQQSIRPVETSAATTDQVFLLTADEVTRYMPSTAGARLSPTPYAGALLPEYNTLTDGTGAWWLLSDGESHADVVLADGRINTLRAYEPAYVRPAIWVDAAAVEDSLVSAESILGFDTDSAHSLSSPQNIRWSYDSSAVSVPYMSVNGGGTVFYVEIPDDLAERIRQRVEEHVTLSGFTAPQFTNDWGRDLISWSAEKAEVHLVFAGDYSQFYSLCRGDGGVWGLDIRDGVIQADSEVRELLAMIAGLTGWETENGREAFSNLTMAELIYNGKTLHTVVDRGSLDLLTMLLQLNTQAGFASKTPMERVQLRLTRSDGSAFSVLLDTDSPRIFLPPFYYYEYNDYESTGTKPLLDALGLEAWPDEIVTEGESDASRAWLSALTDELVPLPTAARS